MRQLASSARQVITLTHLLVPAVASVRAELMCIHLVGWQTTHGICTSIGLRWFWTEHKHKRWTVPLTPVGCLTQRPTAS